MKKHIILFTLCFAISVPAIAIANEPAQIVLEHEGHRYSYTVSQKGKARIISGVETKTGKPFKLYVANGRVRGTVGAESVEFSLHDVQPLQKEATLASK